MKYKTNLWKKLNKKHFLCTLSTIETIIGRNCVLLHHFIVFETIEN